MSEGGLRALIFLIVGIVLIVAGIRSNPGSMAAAIIDTSALTKTG
jgi:hypothetical protein